MDFSSMTNTLVHDRKKAEKEIEYIQQHPGLTVDELHAHIYGYVLYKYNLSGDVADVYSLDELSRISVVKAMKQSKEQSIVYDNKGTYEGATSAMNKKVLLLMAIQRDLGIRFPLNRTVEIKTTWNLAQMRLESVVQ